jgi:MFS family permease
VSTPDQARTDRSLPPRLLALVFAPFAAGYFFSYVFRHVNAVIAKDLAAEFSLSPADVGLLTSMYLLSFAAMQVPVGVFLDRYGPRRVVASLLCIAALGALGFALAGSFGELALGRALIGLGVSACLMGSFKAFTLWFPLARLATLNGWMIAFGGLGGLAATSPVEALLAPLGWRTVFVGMAAGCALAAAAIFFVVPEKPLPGAGEGWGRAFARMGRVFGTLPFWRISLPLMVCHGAYQAMQGLWLAPWLTDVGGLARAAMAAHLFATALAYAIGALFYGWFADFLGDRGVSRLGLYKLGTAIAVAAFIAIAFDLVQAKLPLLMVYGFSSISAALVYALLTRHFPPEMTGRVNTAANVAFFLVSFLCQVGIGVVLRMFPVVDGRYSPEGYMLAFGLIAAAQCVALAWLLPMKESEA